MTQVADVMTRGVRTLSPGDSLQFAAQAMDELNVGAVPVCEGERLVGMVTDRDITVRGVAQGLPVDRATLREVMSESVLWCFEDQALDEAVTLMAQAQVRRLPVVDQDRRVVGIVSLGDVAVKAGTDGALGALHEISQPAEPDRSGNSAASGAAGGGSASGRPSRMP
jgi:CBS-domain-containing membrane protein